MITSIKKFVKKRKLLVGTVAGIVAIVAIYFLFIRKPEPPQTLTVHAGEFLQQVSVSGKVVAAQDVDLSFEQGGIVRAVPVKVGDQVAAGKLLASQDVSQLYTQLAEMKAGIDLQKAKLDQLLAGATPEDIEVAKDGVISARQDLDNSYQNALIDVNTAYNVIYNSYTLALATQNTYFYNNDQQGLKVQDARLAINAAMQAVKPSVDAANGPTAKEEISTAITKLSSALTTTYNQLVIIRNQCDDGIYYSRVSSTDKTSLDTQKTNVNSALTDVVSAQQSIASYKIALQKAQNNLGSVQAPARVTDIAVYKAQIAQAEASEQNVRTQIAKRQIFSPISGTVIAVNAKVGTIMGAGDIAVSVISNGKFQVESYVPEIYVALVKVGDTANITLDAYASDNVFKATVVAIDPSETLKDGVASYKVTLELDDTALQVRDGMTANVVITTEKKENVISVPQKVVVLKDGKKFIEVQVGQTTAMKEVVVGEISSNGQAEITSGLNEGDVVIIK